MTDAPRANTSPSATGAPVAHSPVPADKEARAKPSRWRPPEDWRDRLSARTPEGVLERIVDGDPLRLRRLVGEVIRKERQLADADRVHLRAIACIAHRATSGAGPNSPRWLEERVREALAAVIAAEQAKLESGQPPAPREALAVLAVPLGLHPMEFRRACSILNGRPDDEREAFFAIVIDGLELEAVAASAGVSAVEFARRARRALDAVIQSLGEGSARGTSSAQGARENDAGEDELGECGGSR